MLALLNAAQAVEDVRKDRPGRIRIATRGDRASVRILVEDNGPGIPEGIRQQVFMPFFTTREVGKGMGLGLTLVYDVIVRKHGGTVDVGGKEGEGAVLVLGLLL
jgi:C4-dicarboxylate-specific signal transduction histidine kinase